VKKLKNIKGIREAKWLSGVPVVEPLLEKIKEKNQRDCKSQWTKSKRLYPKRLADKPKPMAVPKL